MPAPALEFDSVSFTYPGSPGPALQDISLTVQPGQRLGILGPNGGGKSTLLKLLLGLLIPQRGSVRVLGSTPAAARAAGRIGYVAQRDAATLAMPLSVRQVVALGHTWRRAPWQALTADESDWLHRLLTLVGAADLAHRHIGSLSGGQLQRALIARALFPKPDLLVLDEPTVGIDIAGQRQFADLLAAVHAALRPTIIVVSHDLRAITAGSDTVACLARRLHSHLAPGGITPELIAEVFSHDVVGLSPAGTPLHVHAHGGDACPACGPGHHPHTAAPPRQHDESGGGAA